MHFERIFECFPVSFTVTGRARFSKFIRDPASGSQWTVQVCLHPNLLLSEVNVSMPIDHEQMRALDDAQVKRFIKYGFIRLDHAFPRELADEGRELLWRDTGCDPHDPATWTQPVGKVRDAETSQPIESVIMALHHANNPINAMGVSTGLPKGRLRLPVPPVPVIFKISAPGYQPWWHGADGSEERAEALHIANGATRELDIRLHRIIEGGRSQ